VTQGEILKAEEDGKKENGNLKKIKYPEGEKKVKFTISV
jgi:hypothetical protein